MSAPASSRPRRQRVGTFLVAWALVMAVPLLGGRLVHVGLAALLAAAFTVVWWFVTDVGVAAESADWRVASAHTLRGRGTDPRASRLQRYVVDSTSGYSRLGSDAALTRTLVDLLEDRVRAHHGVDLDTDPERFATIVGADVADFVVAARASEATIRPDLLSDLVTRIERL